MQLSQLTAISPIDGRYRGKCERLDEFFSEYALIRYRLRVEIEYFIALCGLGLPQLPELKNIDREALRDIYRNFTVSDAQQVKDIERVTNHDVKAVEYYLKEQLRMVHIGLDISVYSEFVHFGLTSQDINNTAVPLALKEALAEVYMPSLRELVDRLRARAQEWEHVAMPAHTHGQPASPTRLGKELMVYVYRLEQQIDMLERVPISGKFGGATGNFNAHHVAFPSVDWHDFANSFLTATLGIEREQLTTQISNYDNLAALLDALRRINTIILDLDRDMWLYISMEYFKQTIRKGEVGSSAMPHKVNPIDFENSEGNLGVANALLAHLAQKLPVSRMQRDLTDSTVLRNLGTPLAHGLIAMASTVKGLDKLLLNAELIERSLADMWPVVAEGIQTILRREGYPNPYEKLKELTRTNARVTRESILAFIDGLDVSDAVKAELRAITPSNYTGI